MVIVYFVHGNGLVARRCEASDIIKWVETQFVWQDGNLMLIGYYCINQIVISYYYTINFDVHWFVTQTKFLSLEFRIVESFYYIWKWGCQKFYAAYLIFAFHCAWYQIYFAWYSRIWIWMMSQVNARWHTI